MTRVSSIFSQILQLIPRLEFESAVHKHGAERHARGFSSWGQFIAMLFCQLGHAKSLREICGGLAASEGKLRHLGAPTAPARSTLAYANEHRPWQLCQTVFEQLLTKCQTLAASQPGTRKKRKFRFKNPLLSLDASVIDLCATMFDWAKFRLTKARGGSASMIFHNRPEFWRMTTTSESLGYVLGHASCLSIHTVRRPAAPRQLCHGPLRRTASVVVCVALAVVDFIVAPR